MIIKRYLSEFCLIRAFVTFYNWSLSLNHFLKVKIHGNIAEKRNLRRRLGSKMGLYNLMLSSSKQCPEKVNLTIVELQQLPNLFKKRSWKRNVRSEMRDIQRRTENLHNFRNRLSYSRNHCVSRPEEWSSQRFRLKSWTYWSMNTFYRERITVWNTGKLPQITFCNIGNNSSQLN